MPDTKLYFIMGSVAFITFVTQMGALMGSSLISNAPAPPSVPSQPNWLDYILMPVWNLGYFFQLMAVSSAYSFVGLILGILSIGMIWAVIELVRGV